MRAKRIVFLGLVGAALFTAYRIHGAPTGIDEEIGTTVVEVTHAEAFAAWVGRVGAGIVGPVVRSFTDDTERLVTDLEPAIQRARPLEARRARTAADEIRRLDGLVDAHLNEGRPIAAIRAAGRGRSLVAAVRHAVAEETAFR